tara:strand:- start:234 stop:851 length:618 start_codon:yes stop_codon:yes gene_type:complete
MPNRFQIKRTATTGLLPNVSNSSNTTYIAAGELAINLTDRKLLSSNGSATFEVGANLASISVSGLSAFGNTTINGFANVSSTLSAGNTTITGFINATGDITAFFSDDRLKDRYSNIPNAVEKVKSLNGFYYEPNITAQDLGYQKEMHVGISAQEVNAIMPEVVAPAPIDNKYLTVKYDRLIPLLIEAIKEQQTQIDELKAQLNKD